jgi:hypothetical protein
MAFSRRKALRFMAGSAVLLAAAGSGAGLWLNRRADRAIAPWAQAASGAFGDWRMQALAFAVLAPNPHNRQPWLLELVGSDTIRIYCELDRRLPVTDPFDRQILIGFGAFLELLRMAAAQAGIALAIETFPEGRPGERLDHRPIAAIRQLSGSVSADPLFAHVLARHTNRQPYRNDTIPAAADAALRAALPAAADFRLHTGEAEVAALRDLTIAGFEREMRTPQAHLESIHLMRIGRAEINANPDGISLDGPMIEFARLAGFVSAEGLADPDSTAFRQGVDKLLASALATPAFVSLSTPGNRRQDQLDAGRDWIRLQLAATGQGLAMQPMSQALQEYAEIADLYQASHALLRPQGGRVQMLGRIGFAPPQRPAPRWPVTSRILNP